MTKSLSNSIIKQISNQNQWKKPKKPKQSTRPYMYVTNANDFHSSELRYESFQSNQNDWNDPIGHSFLTFYGLQVTGFMTEAKQVMVRPSFRRPIKFPPSEINSFTLRHLTPIPSLNQCSLHSYEINHLPFQLFIVFFPIDVS